MSELTRGKRTNGIVLPVKKKRKIQRFLAKNPARIPKPLQINLHNEPNVESEEPIDENRVPDELSESKLEKTILYIEEKVNYIRSFVFGLFTWGIMSAPAREKRANSVLVPVKKRVKIQRAFAKNPARIPKPLQINLRNESNAESNESINENRVPLLVSLKRTADDLSESKLEKTILDIEDKVNYIWGFVFGLFTLGISIIPVLFMIRCSIFWVVLSFVIGVGIFCLVHLTDKFILLWKLMVESNGWLVPSSCRFIGLLITAFGVWLLFVIVLGMASRYIPCGMWS